MKRNLLATAAIAIAALGASAQSYNVVVTETNGTVHTFETSSVKQVQFNEAPAYINLPEFVSGEYNVNNAMGEFLLVLSTGDVDESAAPVDVNGLSLVLALTTEQVDGKAPVLPPGYYRAASGPIKGTFNVVKSIFMLRDAEGAEGIDERAVLGGTVDVRDKDGAYDIRAELTLSDGSVANLRYQGYLDIEAGVSAGSKFYDDFNVDIEGAQGRFYGNWFYPFADDMMLQLYTGTFDANGMQTEGYWIEIPLNMPKVEDPMNKPQRLADGVYTFDPREAIYNNTYLPFTMQPGRDLDFMGSILPAGSRVTYKSMDGNNKQGYLTSGTMTVSNNGTKIELDMTTPEGARMTASFDGRVLIQNFCDNDKTEPEPYDTLTGDYQLNFASGDIAAVWPEGDYIKEGVGEYTIFIGDPQQQKGDFLQLALNSSMTGLENGTYTINDEIKPFCGLRGRDTRTGMLSFTTFADLNSVDGEGILTVGARVNGGTVTIAPGSDENSRKITIDFVSYKGYKITGTFEGTWLVVDPSDVEAPRRINRK